MDNNEWVLVPLNLPHDVLGAAAAAGVFDTGNPSHGWDFLLQRVGIRANPLHPSSFDAEVLISRLMSADPEYKDCASAAVLLRQLTSYSKE